MLSFVKNDSRFSFENWQKDNGAVPHKGFEKVKTYDFMGN